MTYQVGTSCRACSGKAQPGTVDLMRYLMMRFPETGSLGIYNCRPVAGSTTLSKHSCGRAGDSEIPTLPGGAANTEIGYPVVQFLDRYSTEFGIVLQIYDRVIYDRNSPRGRHYGGVHPHYDHDHWEQTVGAATTLRYADYARIAGTGTDQEETMKVGDTGNDVRFFQNALNAWDGTDPKLEVDGIFGPNMAAAVAKYQNAADVAANGEIGLVTAVLLAEYMPDRVGGGGLTQAEADARYAKKTHTHPSLSKVGHVHDEGDTAPSTD